MILNLLRSPFLLGLAHLVVEKNPLEATGEKEPPHLKIDKILAVDYHAKNEIGLPCVRVNVSFNAGKLICKFDISTYLDFEKRFVDPLDAIKRIFTSIPCVRSTDYIGCSCWAIPRKYRTQWGLVERIDY